MTSRWENKGRLKVHYMSWADFKDLVFDSDDDASPQLDYDYIWGGVDFLLNVR